MSPTKKWLDRVYLSKDQHELLDNYEQWAGSYDQDMLGYYGWLAPRHVAAIVRQYTASDACILDAGCGTGLLARQMADQKDGRSFYGIDLSPAMLTEAANKHCYTELRCRDMKKPLDFSDAFFDAVVSVGVFTLGHVGAEGLNELYRVLKKGGLLILGIRPDIHDQLDFRDKIISLHLQAKYASPPFRPMPLHEPNVHYQVIVYEK